MTACTEACVLNARLNACKKLCTHKGMLSTHAYIGTGAHIQLRADTRIGRQACRQMHCGYVPSQSVGHARMTVHIGSSSPRFLDPGSFLGRTQSAPLLPEA